MSALRLLLWDMDNARSHEIGMAGTSERLWSCLLLFPRRRRELFPAACVLGGDQTNLRVLAQHRICLQD